MITRPEPPGSGREAAFDLENLSGGWRWMAALGLAGAALIAGAAVETTRRAFAGHVDRLQRAVDDARGAVGPRTDLPAEVLALARRLGVSGDDRPRLVRLTQSGEMWLKPGGRPLAFTAAQTLAVAQTDFLWRARLSMAAGAVLQVIDYLVGDEAGLEARLMGAVPLVRATGDDAAFRGEAMRYLAELMWNPDALLFNRSLDWRVIDPRTLAVATGDGARRGEVRLILDEAGDLVAMEADDRPRQDGARLVPTPWFGRGGAFRTLGGRLIPTEAEVGWILDGEEFVYWRGRIESWSPEA